LFHKGWFGESHAVLSGAPMKFRNVLTIAAPIVLASTADLPAQTEAPPALELPLACRVGETCFIQQYFDHDSGPGAKDYRCGPMSYNGHDGVDLRAPTLTAQQKGIEVLAAAPGIVRGMRDGVEDVNVRIAGLASVEGRECGNGVVLVHPGGWETQYCHMAKGSVRVKIGQSVNGGTVLGLLGMSGEAEFPHLHFSVRHNGQKVDPFAPDAKAGACGGGQSLWSKPAAAQLAYHSPDIVNAGFVPAPLTMDDVESGKAAQISPAADSPNIIAYVRPIGLKGGDVQIMSLRGPAGLLARTERPPLDGDKAQLLLFIGKKRTAETWPRGDYEAVYEVRRQSVTVLIRRFNFALR
jgi:murein DD-endopeptidase MepM/ murein hydrolase activator NlpD